MGVDPLLREKIWNHMVQISNASQTTILITTHYIEEANKADRVGLMRGGKILTENSPGNLLKIYGKSVKFVLNRAFFFRSIIRLEINFPKIGMKSVIIF